MTNKLYILLLSLTIASCSSSSNDPVVNDPVPGEVSEDGFASCAGLTLPFANLGAEDVDPATIEDQYAALNIWENQVGNTASTAYGSGGYPEAEEGQGDRLFTGGNVLLSVSQQTIAVSADVLSCSFTFSADIGGFNLQEDNATVDLIFLSSTGDEISTFTLGPVTATQREDTAKLLPQETNGTIPATAAQARLVITQNRLAGAANDGYVDNISIVLN